MALIRTWVPWLLPLHLDAAGHLQKSKSKIIPGVSLDFHYKIKDIHQANMTPTPTINIFWYGSWWYSTQGLWVSIIVSSSITKSLPFSISVHQDDEKLSEGKIPNARSCLLYFIVRVWWNDKKIISLSNLSVPNCQTWLTYYKTLSPPSKNLFRLVGSLYLNSQ